MEFDLSDANVEARRDLRIVQLLDADREQDKVAARQSGTERCRKRASQREPTQTREIANPTSQRARISLGILILVRDTPESRLRPIQAQI